MHEGRCTTIPVALVHLLFLLQNLRLNLVMLRMKDVALVHLLRLQPQILRLILVVLGTKDMVVRLA